MWHVSKCESNVSIISDQTIWHVSRHLLSWYLSQKSILYWTVQFKICAQMNEANKNKPIEFYRRLNNDISNVRLNKFCLLGVCARWAHHIWHMYTDVNLRLLVLLLFSISPIHLQPYRIWCARNERITSVFMFTPIAHELPYNKHAFRLLIFFFQINRFGRMFCQYFHSKEISNYCHEWKCMNWIEIRVVNLKIPSLNTSICQMSVLCKWKSARVCVYMCVVSMCMCMRVHF